MRTVLCALLLVSSALAQQPDLEIEATVQARELKFETVPARADVKFTGNPENETVWKTVRTNLPRPVKPGVLYKNPKVHLIIRSTIAPSPAPRP